MAERTGQTKAGATIYSYDAPTDQNEVFATLRKIVADDANARRTRQVFVISGTHGASDGTVTAASADVRFKEEDLDSARITRTNINIRDYHQTAPNRWKELSDKGQNAVLVLAWCYSTKWLTNATANGNNNTKIVMY
ncbi:hypothetical protein POL68_17020 [Stigmatella sp. ncwal1]|uniref:Uncharacterized protein n=1 Tax=Stigmatella ashevillensis TaxID=2995309 RepID=A0ABT5D935_9BACT|nr:hypothetical protein [Stigmatella ashevillena]MDC0710182.1 hypothetical protein [Stigmatella ashevillena]